MTFDLEKFLADNEALCAAATEPCWHVRDLMSEWDTPVILTPPGGMLFRSYHYGKMREDSEFIAQARTSLPLALKLLRKYREALGDCICNGPMTYETHSLGVQDIAREALAYDPIKEGVD